MDAHATSEEPTPPEEPASGPGLGLRDLLAEAVRAGLATLALTPALWAAAPRMADALPWADGTAPPARLAVQACATAFGLVLTGLLTIHVARGRRPRRRLEGSDRASLVTAIALVGVAAGAGVGQRVPGVGAPLLAGGAVAVTVSALGGAAVWRAAGLGPGLVAGAFSLVLGGAVFALVGIGLGAIVALASLLARGLLGPAAPAEVLVRSATLTALIASLRVAAAGRDQEYRETVGEDPAR